MGVWCVCWVGLMQPSRDFMGRDLSVNPAMPKDSSVARDRTCRDFLKGQCTRGAACRFEHPSGRSGSTPSWQRCSHPPSLPQLIARGWLRQPGQLAR